MNELISYLAPGIIGGFVLFVLIEEGCPCLFSQMGNLLFSQKNQIRKIQNPDEFFNHELNNSSCVSPGDINTIKPELLQFTDNLDKVVDFLIHHKETITNTGDIKRDTVTLSLYNLLDKVKKEIEEEENKEEDSSDNDLYTSRINPDFFYSEDLENKELDKSFVVV